MISRADLWPFSPKEPHPVSNWGIRTPGVMARRLPPAAVFPGAGETFVTGGPAAVAGRECVASGFDGALSAAVVPSPGGFVGAGRMAHDQLASSANRSTMLPSGSRMVA
jgi:hypothetical protein